jgi:hypothetical protein
MPVRVDPSISLVSERAIIAGYRPATAPSRPTDLARLHQETLPRGAANVLDVTPESLTASAMITRSGPHGLAFYCERDT